MNARYLLASLALGAAFLMMPTVALADDIPETLEVDTSGTLPPGLKIEAVTGNVKAAKGGTKETRTVERVMTWNEGNGKHAAVFATLKKEGTKDDELWTSVTLFVTTFHVVDDVYEEILVIREVVNPCNLDLEARFLDGSATLTNLDGDDEGELTFGYQVRCAGDVSPSTKKVLMLEGKKRYALRGNSVVDLGDGMLEGGDFKPDFRGAPAAFQKHAEQIWHRTK
jgi:hypothetical protein